MLGVVLQVSRGPFYSPKGPRSHWSSIWKALVAFCPRVHRTLHSATATNHLIGWFPVLGAPNLPVGGTRLSSAPCHRCLPADAATSHWLAGTLNCPALRMDGQVNYSQPRLKFPRAGSLANRAPDCPVLFSLAHIFLFLFCSIFLLLF